LAKSKTHKTKAILAVLFALIVLVLVNVLSTVFHTRFDLTKEGRFSLTEATKDLLIGVDDVVTVKVYLEGEFPAGFKRLKNSTKDMLDEFRAYTGNDLQYEFLDPFEGIDDAKDRKVIYEGLIKKGLSPQRLIENNDEYSEKVIFPGAIVIYRNKEYPINLLEAQRGRAADEVLNNSISLLEFKFANAIQKCVRNGKPRIAFLQGHGELKNEAIADVQLYLSTYYLISYLNLQEFDIVPPQIDVLIVSKPTEKFSELDKFKIDQFIMNGGKVMWLVENLNIEMDSLLRKDEYFATLYDLNLEDMLFKYGVRINDNVIQDIQCSPIPLVVGVDQSGNAQQQKLFPWLYNPIFTNTNQEHPITKNLDAVAGEFVGTIDTIKQEGVKKDILLTSSQYTKVFYHPVLVDLNMVRKEPNKAEFKKSFQPTAVALEGRFKSVFENRLAFETKAILDTIDGFELRDSSLQTKMIVVSDGDIIKNDYDKRNDRPLPLGFDKYTNQTFANKDFILNAIEWLNDNSGIIVSRSKDVKLRLLNSEKVSDEKSYWQLLNIILPLIFVVLLGFVYNFIRRRKFG